MQDRTSPEKRKAIVKAYTEGLTQETIAERFGTSVDTVRRTIKKYKEYLNSTIAGVHTDGQ